MLDATPGFTASGDPCSCCNSQQSPEVSGQLLFPFAEAQEELPTTEGLTPAELAVLYAHAATLDLAHKLSNVVRDPDAGEGRPG